MLNLKNFPFILINPAHQELKKAFWLLNAYQIFSPFLPFRFFMGRIFKNLILKF